MLELLSAKEVTISSGGTSESTGTSATIRIQGTSTLLEDTSRGSLTSRIIANARRHHKYKESLQLQQPTELQQLDLGRIEEPERIEALPYEQPVELQPIELIRPIEQPIELPIEQPIEQPIERPIEQPIEPVLPPIEPINPDDPTITLFMVTVDLIDGRNQFVINGEPAPILDLIVGNTYIFEQLDSSNRGHQFEISELPEPGRPVDYSETIGIPGQPETKKVK